MNASSARPTFSSATVAVKPVMIPARCRRRTRSAAPWGLSPTSAPRLAYEALPFVTSALRIRKSVSSRVVVSTVFRAKSCVYGAGAPIIAPHPKRCEESNVKIGVPTEIKTDEYRVALTPAGVRELIDRGHEVLVQQGAGEGSAIPDAEY